MKWFVAISKLVANALQCRAVNESGSRLERLFVQMREEWSQREEEP